MTLYVASGCQWEDHGLLGVFESLDVAKATGADKIYVTELGALETKERYWSKREWEAGCTKKLDEPIWEYFEY